MTCLADTRAPGPLMREANYLPSLYLPPNALPAATVVWHQAVRLVVSAPALQIDQDGLTLPERTLYLGQDEESEKVSRAGVLGQHPGSFLCRLWGRDHTGGGLKPKPGQRGRPRPWLGQRE